MSNEKAKLAAGSSEPAGSASTGSHVETITCPECGSVEEATVEHTFPFWSYVHHCSECGYIIIESDWENYPKPNAQHEGLTDPERTTK